MKKWLENYWYHYKWRTIIALFFICVLLFGIFSIVGKETYDGYIMIVGDNYLTKTVLIDMKESFKKVGVEDSENRLNFSQLYYDPTNGESYQANEMARDTLATMAVQTYYIYIMTVDVYNIYKDTGVFEKLDDIFTTIPSTAYDECAIKFNETDFSKYNAGVDSLGSDLVMALKVIPYTRTASSQKKEKALYEYHKQLFINIVEYKK